MKNMLIEPTPGANNYINTKQADPGPPEGFVDSTVYIYKVGPNGEEVLTGTQEPFPLGWEEAQTQKIGRAKTAMPRTKNYLQDTEQPAVEELEIEPTPIVKAMSLINQILAEGTAEDFEEAAYGLRMVAGGFEILANVRPSREVRP